MVKLIQTVISWVQSQRLKFAIRKANKIFAATGMKMFVLKYRRGFLVKSKQEMKKLIKEGYFKKGFTIQTAEAIALYQTR